MEWQPIETAPRAVQRLLERMREAAILESNQGRPGCAWLLDYWRKELYQALLTTSPQLHPKKSIQNGKDTSK